MFLLHISKIKKQQNVCLVLIFGINTLSILIVKIKYLKILLKKKKMIGIEYFRNN
jgi:hypothetical protein